MIHKRILQITSVAMAVLVLVSTLSVSIEKHYCGEHLVDVSIFAEAEKCGMENEAMTMPASDEAQMLMSQSCCSDVVDLVEGQDELTIESSMELNKQQKVFLFSYAYAFSGLFDFEPRHEVPYEHYSPPNVVEDIQVLNEVFLI
ncbi:HYC_CC_PP family protein [Lutimonas sp.]|uniref:HYC_CC_PP family protein n=1 Tax=Lutimonas sp. TaxID=1872403 RepID=UPI003D9BD615